MKILLLGANGRTGREVMGRALESGDRVTALVRGEDRLADLHHDRLRVRVGNPCDPAFLEELLPGHDLVVSVLGPRWPSKAASAIYPDSAAALVDAMGRSDVRRLLVTSSALLFGRDTRLDRLLRWLVPSIVDGARQMEDRIRASGLQWTIARTGFLTNGTTTRYRQRDGALPEGAGSISRAAVARFLLAEAAAPSQAGQVVGLCG
ncbi:MAG: NAD(P)-binding oxidoreductase [Myxococcota bacterium]